VTHSTPSPPAAKIILVIFSPLNDDFLVQDRHKAGMTILNTSWKFVYNVVEQNGSIQLFRLFIRSQCDEKYIRQSSMLLLRLRNVGKYRMGHSPWGI
jgi:hypothetical protein